VGTWVRWRSTVRNSYCEVCDLYEFLHSRRVPTILCSPPLRIIVLTRIVGTQVGTLVVSLRYGISYSYEYEDTCAVIVGVCDYDNVGCVDCWKIAWMMSHTAMSNWGYKTEGLVIPILGGRRDWHGNFFIFGVSYFRDRTRMRTMIVCFLTLRMTYWH